MYRLVFSLFLCLSFFSCGANNSESSAEDSSQPSEVTEAVKAKKGQIAGKLAGLGDAEIKLFQQCAGHQTVVASSKAKQDAFVIDLPKKLPLGLYLLGTNAGNAISIVLPDGAVDVSGDLAQPTNATIEASGKENKAFNEYKSFNADINQKFESLNKEAQALQAKYKSNPAELETKFEEIKPKYAKLQEEQKAKYKSISKDYEGTFTSQLAVYMIPEDFEENPFPYTEEDFNNNTLALSNAYLEKIVSYVRVQGAAMGYTAALDKFKPFIDGKEQSDEAVYLSLILLYGEVGDQASKAALLKEYMADFENSEYASALQATLPPMIGEKAPDIELAGLDGNPMALSDLEGKVVLLDFWASWCRPCRSENPNVVKAYDRFKDKGFTVFSVSLDKTKGAWEKAIQQDNLKWDNHVSDLKGWSSAGAARYKVRSIPATYLIGKDGKIIAQNLRGEALEQKLEELLQ